MAAGAGLGGERGGGGRGGGEPGGGEQGPASGELPFGDVITPARHLAS
jgi:hypothetical protein